MMCLRELPRSNGAGPVGTKHLVATTKLSRLPCSQRPRISSVTPRVESSPPSGYASELSRNARDVGSSHCSPKVIVPRHSLDTWRPVRPSRLCSTPVTLPVGALDNDVQAPSENSTAGALN